MLQSTIDLNKAPLIAENESNSWIQHYDEAASLAIPGYEAMHTMSLACLQAHLPEQANVLSVGAGTGTELIRLGEANPHWQLLGVDPSAEMLAIAAQKITHHQLSDRVKLMQGYTHELSLDTLYHAATSIMVLHFIPDAEKLQFLQSIAQRLHSSAPLVIVNLFGKKGGSDLNQLMPILQTYWDVMALPPQRKKEVIEGFDQNVHPLSESSILDLLKQAGFQGATRFYTGLWVGGWLVFKA